VFLGVRVLVFVLVLCRPLYTRASPYQSVVCVCVGHARELFPRG
jgi:hypothetical protein